MVGREAMDEERRKALAFVDECEFNTVGIKALHGFFPDGRELGDAGWHGLRQQGQAPPCSAEVAPANLRRACLWTDR
jgi:hypothetical protein